MLMVGTVGPFTAVDGSDESVSTKMRVSVRSAKYMSAAELGASHEPKRGQYVVLTLTIKNVGNETGRFSPYGAMRCQDGAGARDCTTRESVGGRDVDRQYAPGQSVTGSVVLDVVRRGGTVTYFDAPGRPSFTVLLPS
ncbi:hypothetical protein GCM10011579_067930 [Streptomyces albiflavescens]|uniref:DUF4352 domain-containing protein n=1 Tax=Streptomyces albiflavescens TaxID=1623582 RepID=A0A918D8A5_9ACTN|nr:hypothetical protein GCM10011579_067930 [Streptomyces albiflavescens]